MRWHTAALDLRVMSPDNPSVAPESAVASPTPPAKPGSPGRNALARLQLVINTLAFETPQPPRRLRRSTYALAAAFSFGLGGMAAAALSTAVLLGADPLRVISRPLAGVDAARRDNAAAVRTGIRSIQSLQDRLFALEGRFGRVDAAGGAHAALQQGRVQLQTLLAQQAALLRQKGVLADARVLAKNAAEEADAAALAAAKAFIAALSDSLLRQIARDEARAEALAAAGWPISYAQRAAILAQAREPIGDLRRAAVQAVDFEAAAALAIRLSDIAAAMGPVRAPLLQAEALREARARFTEADSAIRSELADLRGQAEDRPGVFASAERKSAWREAQARWATVAPLVAQLDALQTEVFASNSAAVAASAARRLDSLAADIRTKIAAPAASLGPEARAPALSERGEAAQRRIAEVLEAAEATYNDVFESARPWLNRQFRRRRDRDAAEELQGALRGMHETVQRLERIARSTTEAEDERALDRGLEEARQQLRGFDEEARRARRAIRALE